mmetsp:Transcript_53028/g.123290  ORF Transcript_53028/g.123290 Transcript_53028/m.123290 type:complete len:223 (+) Transcript_53028:341-1009(+)
MRRAQEARRCATRPGGGRHGRLASAAAALADADVPCAHNVRAVAQLLRDAALGHGALGLPLLPVELHALPELVLVGVDVLARAHLAAALVLGLLLVVVLGVDDADDVHLMGEADVRRKHQVLAIWHPTHLLHRVHHRGSRLDSRRDLRIRQLHRAELLLRRVPDHVPGELVDEVQGLLRGLQGQGPQGLLQRRQRLRHLVPRRVSCVAHGCHTRARRGRCPH